MRKLVPVILCGGAGTRLWPLSTAERPKPFLKLAGAHSLFQDTVLRCGAGFVDCVPIVCGSAMHRKRIFCELGEIGVQGDIVLEPASRNTAPAIVLACLQALERDWKATVFITPSDNFVGNLQGFHAALESATELAQRSDQIVIFGVKPSRPLAGYGYIQTGDPVGEGFTVERFHEKPSASQAKMYAGDGFYLNSGSIVASARLILDELTRFEPDLVAAARLAFERGSMEPNVRTADADAYGAAPSISIDHALLERTGKAAVVSLDCGWADAGCWQAIADLHAPDAAGNVIVNGGRVRDGAGNIVHGSGPGAFLMGISNTLVVTTPQTVLVCDRGRLDEIAALADIAEPRVHDRTEPPARLRKPWGFCETLALGDGYRVKRITVERGGVLSLQAHRFRDEHWTIVEGVAEAVIDGKPGILCVNETVHIPRETKHRLANPGPGRLVLIEVQTGSYCGEDDIIRYEDEYGRV